MAQFISQLQQMFTAGAGDSPVNWDLARQIALAALTTPSPATSGTFPVGFAPSSGAPSSGTPGPDVPSSGTPGSETPGMGAGGTEPSESTVDVPSDLAGAISDAVSGTGAAGPVGDPPLATSDHIAVTEAMRLADLWLENTCALPSGIRTSSAWTRADWINYTLPVWQKLCDPVAGRMVAAMGDIVPEEMRDQLGPMASMVSMLGGALFGGQLGQALGSLAAEVLSAGDIGLPLGPAGEAALVPANIAAVSDVRRKNVSHARPTSFGTGSIRPVGHLAWKASPGQLQVALWMACVE
jgi:uncharacterized protein (DUF2342 family)